MKVLFRKTPPFVEMMHYCLAKMNSILKIS